MQWVWASDPSNFRWKGNRDGGKRYLCKVCGTWGTTGTRNFDYSYSNHGDSAEICIETDRRIRNEKDLIEVTGIDTEVWQIDKFLVNKHEAYCKNRQTDLRFDNGKISGSVYDTGKLTVEPLFSVRVWLKRKTQEIRSKLVVADLVKDAEKFAPKYPKINYPKIKRRIAF